MLKTKEFEFFLERTLESKSFVDYGPNGLQVQGKGSLKKVAFAVSATRESIEDACAWKADALVVHHGLFWKFHGVRPLTGAFYNRVAPLIKSDVNLFGYHLPLDGHIEFGNAAMLARNIGAGEINPFYESKGKACGVSLRLKQPLGHKELEEKLVSLHKTQCKSSRANDQKIETIGIVTGGANSGWEEAASEGLDAYITGEMSEHDWHDSKENGVSMFAVGHHASERWGVLALEQLILKTFPELETRFFDSQNPA